MPFTFLAHQAPVAPLKLRWPRAFDGAALALGSMAPDFEYYLRGAAWSEYSHTLVGQFSFCLPLTLATVWVTRRVLAPVLPSHLPDAGDFHLRDLSVLSVARPALAVTVASALLGSFSHIAWDACTHSTGAVVHRVPLLQRAIVTYAGRPLYVYKVLQHTSTVVGALVTLHFARAAGRLRWRLDAPCAEPVAFVATRASHRRLWVCVATGAVLRAALAFALRPSFVPFLSVGMAVRVALSLLAGGFIGAVVGCVALRRAR